MNLSVCSLSLDGLCLITSTFRKKIKRNEQKIQPQFDYRFLSFSSIYHEKGAFFSSLRTLYTVNRNTKIDDYISVDCFVLIFFFLQTKQKNISFATYKQFINPTDKEKALVSQLNKLRILWNNIPN